MLKAIDKPARIKDYNSFSIKVLQKEALTARNHHHQEFEVAFISKGTGKRTLVITWVI